MYLFDTKFIEILLQNNEINLFSSVMSQVRTLVWRNIQNTNSERQLTVNDANYYNRVFNVFLTVHHSIDLFHLPTLIHNSFTR